MGEITKAAFPATAGEAALSFVEEMPENEAAASRSRRSGSVPDGLAPDAMACKETGMTIKITDISNMADFLYER
jgi:hypothetical protein